MNLMSEHYDSHQMAEYQEIKFLLHGYLIAEIEAEEIDIATMSDMQLRSYVSTKIFKFASIKDYVLNSRDVNELTTEMVNELAGLGPLQTLIDDEDIDDILVNGAEKIFIEQKGKLSLTKARFIDDDHILRVIRRILAPLGRRIDESSPLVDARLSDGSRINAIIPPLALNGPCLSIRKFRREPFSGDTLIELNTLSSDMLGFLMRAVEHKANIMISGGTGTGKTTMLNLLSSAIGINERIVTIEDAAELKLNHEHVIRLETRPANLEGVGEINARDLVKNALRMRPDRIILGEIRGNEVLDVLQAMNTGHEGSMSTIHANNPSDALLRIEMLAGIAGFKGSDLTLRKMISAAIDLIVQIARLPNGERKITSIQEIIDVRDNIFVTNELYSYDLDQCVFCTHPLPTTNSKFKSINRLG